MERWAFACKVLNGSNEQTWLETIQKGVKKTEQQMEKQNCVKGCVIVSVQNIFSRNILRYSSHQAIKATLEQRSNEFSQKVQERFIGTDEINVLFRDPRMERGIIIYFEDIFHLVESCGGIVLSTLWGEYITRGREVYSPYSYAQHITFDGSGRLASSIVNKMLEALSGPNTSPLDVP